MPETPPAAGNAPCALDLREVTTAGAGGSAAEAAGAATDGAATAGCDGQDYGREDPLVGEWRQVENVITIARPWSRGGLKMTADPAQPPLDLVWRKGGRWQARRSGTGEGIYELSLAAKDVLEVYKGERSLKIFRIARSRTLLGDWVHRSGKVLLVAEAPLGTGAGAGALELRCGSRAPLLLVRARIAEWEAQPERHYGAQSVYVIEHMEGSHRILVRRPLELDDGYCPPLEFLRVGSALPPPPPLAPLAYEHPPPVQRRGYSGAFGHSYGRGPCGHDRECDRGLERWCGYDDHAYNKCPEYTSCSREQPAHWRGSSLAGDRDFGGVSRERRLWCGGASASGCPPPRARSSVAPPPEPNEGGGRDVSPHEEDLEDFCTKNNLSDRVVAALRAVGRREQQHIMGLDGGRNSFQLTGHVRDPNAVVLSRLKRLREEPLEPSPAAGGGGGASPERSRSRWRWRSPSSPDSSSRSRSTPRRGGGAPTRRR